ncbi:component of TRAPP complex [Reticulomyxa filosa]|uniref:Trafficking protein particle complex subunit n=1 Tax=Reticulomyxa filosa TaxID=46433 RepID=X6MTQ8_RETFI|nr:component of TRAPP complex [Reticulomyxa filosa]|eukprot:ETO16490.1 component of TRAPP complex [Reticulomyxa filosa]
MTIHSLLILSRSGLLVFCKDFVKHPRLKPNDWIRVTGIFHGMSEVIKQLSPLPTKNDGISSVEDETFRLHCYQTLTGLKFIVTATPTTENLERLLKDVYGLYCDFVMKDPFHKMEQPIKSHKFIEQLDTLVQRTSDIFMFPLLPFWQDSPYHTYFLVLGKY